MKKTDEVINKEREKSEKLERDQELEDIRTLLNNPAGLRFFKRFMKDGMVFKTTFTGNSNGYFLEGHRNLALMYFRDICEADASKVPEIMIEKTEDK
jgi:hypothetical protein